MSLTDTWGRVIQNFATDIAANPITLPKPPADHRDLWNTPFDGNKTHPRCSERIHPVEHLPLNIDQGRKVNLVYAAHGHPTDPSQLQVHYHHNQGAILGVSFLHNNTAYFVSRYTGPQGHSGGDRIPYIFATPNPDQGYKTTRCIDESKALSHARLIDQGMNACFGRAHNHKIPKNLIDRLDYAVSYVNRAPQDRNFAEKADKSGFSACYTRYNRV